MVAVRAWPALQSLASSFEEQSFSVLEIPLHEKVPGSVQPNVYLGYTMIKWVQDERNRERKKGKKMSNLIPNKVQVAYFVLPEREAEIVQIKIKCNAFWFAKY